MQLPLFPNHHLSSQCLRTSLACQLRQLFLGHLRHVTISTYPAIFMTFTSAHRPRLVSKSVQACRCCYTLLLCRSLRHWFSEHVSSCYLYLTFQLRLMYTSAPCYYCGVRQTKAQLAIHNWGFSVAFFASSTAFCFLLRISLASSHWTSQTCRSWSLCPRLDSLLKRKWSLLHYYCCPTTALCAPYLNK